ncbi:hydroxyacid dehydrogenase [Enterococcus diestrammenae]|uniref:D-3-phosphoglycerate dehydrogenase/2-oxoglutarate reductase n=1 Tax=Enterococcus diestrammenae TaxID=1155073 RepID=A0ABV0EZU5_9ENTE|nr:hydroxyacid dehydrogenase [Enterococcus diestrammenae]KAF1295036.1 3-phosphoglycerate dehydrogenase [Enterococcus diestrammenae]
MAKKVYIPQDIAEVGKTYLQDRGYEIVMGTSTDAGTVVEEAQGAEGVLLRLMPFTKEIIQQLPNLKVIARHGVGFDNVDIASATEAGVWVTITPMANASSVAETTLTLLLNLAKRIQSDVDHMRQGDFFYKNQNKGMDLAGKTVGLVGYGKIGREFARKMGALDVDVLVHDPFIKACEYGQLVSRDELLAKADFVSLHLPATAETEGSFGAAEFKKMKNSASLINVARGSLVDEPALIAALENGDIAGAALDVYSQEPLPLDHPFYSMENVLLTPHIASNTVETMDRMALHAAQEIHRVLSGGNPEWPVNRV